MIEFAHAFTDRVTIVTGGTRGIGLAIARGFVAGGARVVVTGRDAQSLEQAAQTLGPMARAVHADIAVPEHSRRVVDETLRAFGQIDVLVNNAGRGLVAPSESVGPEDWQAVVNANLSGTFQMAQVVGREMLRHGRGTIINIGSLTTFLGFPQRAAYGATKAAVAELTRTLASEWGPRGIRVNCVAPGYIGTDPVRRLIAEGVVSEQRIVARTPLGRLGVPEDLVGPVLFLASDAARFVNGVTLPVDGGWLAYGYL